jgi:hypothetical protein
LRTASIAARTRDRSAYHLVGSKEDRFFDHPSAVAPVAPPPSPRPSGQWSDDDYLGKADFSMVSRFSMPGQSVISQKKRRGPPPTGKGHPIMVRLQPAMLARVDRWAASQGDDPSRPETIRRLIDRALSARSTRRR